VKSFARMTALDWLVFHLWLAFPEVLAPVQVRIYLRTEGMGLPEFAGVYRRNVWSQMSLRERRFVTWMGWPMPAEEKTP
jgi:hypothetical protein